MPSPVPAPPGAERVEVHMARVEMVAAGDAASFTMAQRDAIAAILAAQAGVSPADVTVTITSGSVRIVCNIVTADATAAAVASTTLQMAMATPETATALLFTAAVTVIAAPTVPLAAGPKRKGRRVRTESTVASRKV